ncbi:MAG TPA: fucose isomerase [Fusobacteriaceae bacterium]|nr:fucose isomerase [Fusobacteriaceae bacterium]
MLKNIPSILPPELLKILMEMGHGDGIVIADGNFPGASLAKRLVRCDGHNIPELLDAILKFFPLDQYVDKPLSLMAAPLTDKENPTIWNKYRDIVDKHEKDQKEFNQIERFAFYDQAKKSYAIISTGEKALLANIILKKGVVIEK